MAEVEDAVEEADLDRKDVVDLEVLAVEGVKRGGEDVREVVLRDAEEDNNVLEAALEIVVDDVRVREVEEVVSSN